jgi:IPT/TIG domain-containing protein
MRLTNGLQTAAACMLFGAIGLFGIVGPAWASSPTTQVRKISPAGGPEFSSIPVKITGSNFNVAPDETQIYFGTEPATSVSCVSTRACTAMTPELPEGAVDVSVTSNGMTSTTTVTFDYELYSPPTVPVISGGALGFPVFTKANLKDRYAGIFDPGNVYLQIPNATDEVLKMNGPLGLFTLEPGQSQGFNLPVREATPYVFRVDSGANNREFLTLRTKTPK